MPSVVFCSETSKHELREMATWSLTNKDPLLILVGVGVAVKIVPEGKMNRHRKKAYAIFPSTQLNKYFNSLSGLPAITSSSPWHALCNVCRFTLLVFVWRILMCVRTFAYWNYLWQCSFRSRILSQNRLPYIIKVVTARKVHNDPMLCTWTMKSATQIWLKVKWASSGAPMPTARSQSTQQKDRLKYIHIIYYVFLLHVLVTYVSSMLTFTLCKQQTFPHAFIRFRSLCLSLSCHAINHNNEWSILFVHRYYNEWIQNYF